MMMPERGGESRPSRLDWGEGGSKEGSVGKRQEAGLCMNRKGICPSMGEMEEDQQQLIE